MRKITKLEKILYGIGALGAAFTLTPKVRADDVFATNDISYVTSIDSDGDRLTNDQEITFGTNPNDSDSDNDGFLDGIEAVNPGRDGNALSDSNPDIGHSLYNFATTQNLTTGTTKNAMNPFWFIGGRVAYIENDANTFANGSIYIKNINDLSVERRSLVTGLDAQLRELSSTPLGGFVHFHDNSFNGKSGIWKKTRGIAAKKESIPASSAQAAILNYNIRNPSIVGRLTINPDSTLSVNGNAWALAETDNPTSATGQLYAFRLQSTLLPATPGFGGWDGSTPVKITNFANKIARPKVSRDGDKIMFQRVMNDGTTYLGVYQGLQSILSGAKGPYDFANLDGDLRGDQTIATPDTGVAFPGGFGGAGNIVYWTQDMNNLYRLTTPLDFSTSDFDVFVSPVGVVPSGRFSIVNPGKMRIPLPGNQITPAVSKEGRRIAFADDYLADGIPGGNFNLYAVSCNVLGKLQPGMDLLQLNGFVDPSGLTFYGGRGDQLINLTQAVPDDGFSTNTLTVYSPLKAVSDAGLFGVTNIGKFGPSGLALRYDAGADKNISLSLNIEQPWGVEDLVTNLDDAGNATAIDESTLQPAVYDTSTSQYIALPAEQIKSIDRVNRKMNYFVQHFSNYGMIGNLIQVPNASKDWQMYE